MVAHHDSARKNHKIEYSVVIPVYNSTDSLKELFGHIKQAFNQLNVAHYQVIMVDDKSPCKETWPYMVELAKAEPDLVVIQLTKNFGRHSAVLCGLSHAQGEYVFVMDDDLQHHPRDFSAFIEQKHHDLVIAKFPQKHHSWFKQKTSKLKGVFDCKVAGKPKDIQMGPYVLMKRKVAEAALRIRTPYPMLAALWCFVTSDMVNVTIEHYPRIYGKSNFTLKKLFGSFFNLVFNNSSFLLRKVAQAGFIISLGSFLLALYLIGLHLVHHMPIPGWTSIMVLVAIQGGIIILALAIIGEYLIRLVGAAEARPSYIVNEVFSQRD